MKVAKGNKKGAFDMVMTMKARVVGTVVVPINDYAKIILQDEDGKNHEVNMSLSLAREKDIYYGDVVELEYNNRRPTIEKRIVRGIPEERDYGAEPL